MLPPGLKECVNKARSAAERVLTASRVGGELRWEYDDILHEEVAVSRLLKERHALALDRLHEAYNKTSFHEMNTEKMGLGNEPGCVTPLRTRGTMCPSRWVRLRSNPSKACDSYAQHTEPRCDKESPSSLRRRRSSPSSTDCSPSSSIHLSLPCS